MDFPSSPKLTSSLFLPTQSLIKKAQRFLCICLHGCQHSRLIVEQPTMHWEIVEPEAGVVDSKSICSANVLVQSIHACPLGIFIHKKAVYLMVRERKSWSQLIISRLASAPLPRVQWLSGTSIQLIIKRSWV